MSPTVKIGIAFAITVLAVIAALWQIANVRGAQNRGRRRGPGQPPQDPRGTQQRRSDERTLSGPEKRLYTESQRLLAQGKVPAASRILEQLGMQRESIQVLEDAGLIHDAAKILMRMQRHNRAGVVYARHGMWEHAAQCFKLANMPLEVAKCAREAGDLATAAQYFEAVGRFEDAGECYEQMSDFHKAARLFSNAGHRQRAMSLYNRLAAATANLSTVEFEEQEIQQIVDYLGDGHVDQGLAAVVVSRNKLTNVILNLITKDMGRQAAELYTRSAADIGPMLMAEVNYQNASAGCLADVFLNVSAFHYAGMIYERMGEFGKAAEAFERAEDFERASYCYERAGHEGMARSLKEKAKTTPYRGGGQGNRGGFALASVTAMEQGAFASESSESTAVMDMNQAQRAPAPPPPLPPRAAETPQAPQAPQTPPAAPPPRPLTLQAEADDDDRTPIPAPAQDAAEASPVKLEEGRSAFHRARFFADLDYDQKNKLWEIGETLEFDANETVLTYNDEPKGVYVIIQGSVSCYKQVGGKESYVDQMGEAESFGELWLLADQPTAVRFVASKATKIHVIEREPFTELLDNDGTIARKVYKRFTTRLLKRLLSQQNPRKTQAAS